jgi:PAS domain-containing protein
MLRRKDPEVLTMANKDVQKTLEELLRNLQENKAWLEEAQRVAHVGYWVWDLQTNHLIWSDETYRIFGLTPLRNFMNDKCGLVNQANPCRCAKKTRGFLQAGYVDPQNLLFVRERIREVRQVAPKVHETINALDGKCAEVFRGHPFYEAPDLGPMLRRLVERPDLKLSM